MMTVMCPNCRHRFPAPDCCNTALKTDSATMQQSTSECSGSRHLYNCSGHLVPHGYNISNNINNNSGCIVNAPTIVNGPTIIQTIGRNPLMGIDATGILDNELWNNQMKNLVESTNCRINTTCDLTGGSVTITTPGIQSGGYFIQSNNSDIIIQVPRIEIKPKLSDGNNSVQKKSSTEDLSSSEINFTGGRYSEALSGVRYFEESPLNEDRTEEMVLIPPPSGCQELPGIRRQNASVKSHDNSTFPYNQSEFKESSDTQTTSNSLSNQNSHDKLKRTSGCCCGSSNDSCQSDSSSSTSTNNPSTPFTGPTTTPINSQSTNAGSVQIQVNATVQLPSNVEQCIVNISTTTNQSSLSTTVNSDSATIRRRNNFNGGGLIQPDTMNHLPLARVNVERADDTPTTPISWMMPFPWGLEAYPQERDNMKLIEVKRLLHIGGWYHEDLNWQQSEKLLKNSPVGRWLMRDSSDKRYTFAISVQTTRGPTSVRVHYFCGRFRLDSEPRLALAMPLFHCPIRMLEYYVEYSSQAESRREVWVDYSGQLYSQIFLSQPLVKEIRSLSHLARLAINRNKIKTGHLPPPIKTYLAEYPYLF